MTESSELREDARQWGRRLRMEVPVGRPDFYDPTKRENPVRYDTISILLDR